jgi:hypothetical protein
MVICISTIFTFRPLIYNNFKTKGMPKMGHYIARYKLALIDGLEVGCEVGFFVGQFKFFSDIFSVKRDSSVCNI